MENIEQIEVEESSIDFGKIFKDLCLCYIPNDGKRQLGGSVWHTQ